METGQNTGREGKDDDRVEGLKEGRQVDSERGRKGEGTEGMKDWGRGGEGGRRGEGLHNNYI